MAQSHTTLVNMFLSFLHTAVMHIAVNDINEVWLLHTHWKVH